jgi:CHAT domain-containing protein
MTLSPAVSWYIPTFRALSLARDRFNTSMTERDSKVSLLLITIPQTPEKAALLRVEDEVDAIKTTVQPEFVVRRLNHPSADTVKPSLDEYDIVHFASHGVSDQNRNGLDSYLVLHKPSDDSSSLSDYLHVRRVFERKFERAKIAYLSACSTAGIFEGRLADEVIHLASAFLVAGFRHVIGAL